MSQKIGWYHRTDETDQWDGFNHSGIEHFRGNPIPHLAREINQNAMDAGISDLVEVKFKLHRVDTASVPHIVDLKRNIKSCYEAAKNESEKAKIFFKNAIEKLDKSKISVLEISDFNTSGMKGPSTNGTPFFAFMKAKGLSIKELPSATENTSALGSYGIGKFAPYAVSDIRTVFVSTVYQDDLDDFHQLTQGRSILMSHDIDGFRKEGVGFWGIEKKCQPVSGVSPDLPVWIQRESTEENIPDARGSKITILCFNEINNWREELAVSVAENFFGSICQGSLSVDIDGEYKLDQNTISDFFSNSNIRKSIKNLKDEPDRFDNSRNYLKALNTTEVLVEESEMVDLGLCQVRILIGENLPKKVCALRNGMYITDRLQGLKVFSDFKEFVAVFHCQNPAGNELLRAMEPPRHDDFEPDRLSTKDQQRKGKRALKRVATWIRDMLKRHAKEPVSEVTQIDELKEFFGDEGEEGSGKGVEEINPFGEVVIRAKPIKTKVASAKQSGEGAEGGGGDGGEGGGGNQGSGGGDGEGGKGNGAGGTGGGIQKPLVGINNVRALMTDPRNRKLAFTPVTNGNLALRVLEAGADNDYDVSIINTDQGTIDNGRVILPVTAGNRCIINVELDQEFSGAVKVEAYEI